MALAVAAPPRVGTVSIFDSKSPLDEPPHIPDSAMPSSSSKASLSCSCLSCRSSCSLPSSTVSRHWGYRVSAERPFVPHLVDADVLLLSLDHPHPLLPHLVDDPEDVDHVVLPDALQDSVQSNHRSTPAHAGAGMGIVRTTVLRLLRPSVSCKLACSKTYNLERLNLVVVLLRYVKHMSMLHYCSYETTLCA